MADTRYTPHPRRTRKTTTAPAVEIAPPRHLRGRIRACFVELETALRGTGRLAPEDVFALEAFATTLARVREADEIVAQDGAYLEARNGIRYAHPALKIGNEGRRDLRAWAARFGATFKDRELLRVDPAQPDTEIGGLAELCAISGWKA